MRLAAVLTALSLAAGATTAAVGAAALTSSAALAQAAEGAQPTPQGACGPGSKPEPGMQGRVPADDVAAGGAADGNAEVPDVIRTAPNLVARLLWARAGKEQRRGGAHPAIPTVPRTLTRGGPQPQSWAAGARPDGRGDCQETTRD